MCRIDMYLRRFSWWRKLRGIPEPRPLSGVTLTAMREMLAVTEQHSAAFGQNVSLPSGGGNTIKIRRPARYSQAFE